MNQAESRAVALKDAMLVRVNNSAQRGAWTFEPYTYDIMWELMEFAMMINEDSWRYLQFVPIVEFVKRETG